MFADQFIHNCGSSNLKDDEHNHQTEALHASAWAERELGKQIRSLMLRVKYCDGPLADQLAKNSPNLKQLVEKWLGIVTEKGKDRNWVKIRGEWDATMALKLFSSVATHSLEYYLDGMCRACNGTGAKDAKEAFKTCHECQGSRKAKLPPMSEYERKLVMDMVGELEALESTHAGCASKLMRRDV